MSRNASLERFKARLARVPAAVRAEVNREVEKQAGQIVVNMRIKAPSDTGTLRRSIAYIRGNLRASIVAGGDPTTKKSKASLARSFVYSVRGALGRKRGNKTGEYDYAFAVEFGTQKMAPKPFFYSTWRRARGGARKAIRAAVKRGLNNVR
ncbi:MAG: HK97-gp10 family putative phage morphogenesis protein [Albidovulum sp.]